MSEIKHLRNTSKTAKFRNDSQSLLDTLSSTIDSSSPDIISLGQDVSGKKTDITELSELSPTQTRYSQKLFALRQASNKFYETKAGEFAEPIGGKSRFFGAQRNFDSDKEVLIGVVRTTVPPESVLVEEIKGMKSFQGLRTQNNFQVKTGQGHLRVNLKISFPDEESVNTELRHIIGQFRTTPFTTLESQFIYDIVVGKVGGALANSNNSLDSLRDRSKKLSRDVKASTSRVSLLATKIRTKFGIIYPGVTAPTYSGSVASFIKSIEEFEARYIDIRDLTLLSDEENVLENIEALKAQIVSEDARLKNMVTRAADSTISISMLNNRLPIIPVLFESIAISTVPAFPSQLEAHISFVLFNHVPHTNDVLFKDLFGGWTRRLSNCFLFRDYYTRRMQPNDLDIRYYDKNISDTVIRYPEPDNLGVNLLSPNVSRNQLDKALSDDDSLVDKGFWQTLVLEDSSDNFSQSEKQIYVQNVNVALTTNLPKIRISSSQYPTYQYIGGVPGRASIRFMCKYEQVGSLHKIKRNLDRLTIDSGGRAARKNFISIENQVLNITGFKEFQITAVNTYSVDNEWCAVEWQLSSFVEPPKNTLRFIRQFSDSSTRDYLKFCFLEILKLAKSLTEQYSEKTRFREPSVLEKQALEFLENQGRGLLTRPFVWSVVANDPSLFKKIEDFTGAAVKERVSNNDVYAWRAGIADGLYTLTTSDVPWINEYQEQRAVSVEDVALNQSFLSGAVYYNYLLLQSLFDGNDIDVVNETTREVHRVAHPLYSENDIRYDFLYNLISSLERNGFDILFPSSKTELTKIGETTASFYGFDLNTLAGLKALFFADDPSTQSYKGQKEAVARLSVVAMGTSAKYKELSDYLSKKYDEIEFNLIGDQKDVTEPYPDMKLPTYEEVFQRFVSTVRELNEIDETLGTDEVLSRHWINAIPARQQNAVQTMVDWRNSAKTDLPEDIREKFDVSGPTRVDPDFYFFNAIDALEIEDTFGDDPGTFDQLTGNTVMYRTREEVLEATTIGRSLLNSKLSSDSDSAPAFKDLSYGKRKRAFDPALNQLGLSNFSEDYAPGSSIYTGLQTYNPDGAAQMRELFERSRKEFPPRRSRMSSFYPTFQLFFVRRREGFLELESYTDFYGYTSVADLNVTRHKTQPDVAEFKLINTLGQFDDIKFDERLPGENISKDGRKVSSLFRSALPESVQDAVVSTEPKRQVLSEGTQIVIKMGYSANPKDLETVFTGQIAEVMYGDVISIVAQGYGGELQFPISETSSLPIGGFIDRILKGLGFRTDRGHKILSIIHEILEKTPTQFLGRWNLGDVLKGSVDLIDPREFGENFFTPGREDVRDQTNSRLKRILALVFSDPKLENVGGLVGGSMFRDLDSGEELDILKYKKEWLLKDDMTAMQAIREICLMLPSLICTVRPYDERGTLIVGRPESRYFTTNQGRARRIRAQATLSDLSKTNFVDSQKDLQSIAELIKEFQSSRQFETLKEYSAEVLSLFGVVQQYHDLTKLEEVAPRALSSIPLTTHHFLEADNVAAHNIFGMYTKKFGSSENASVVMGLLFAYFNREAFSSDIDAALNIQPDGIAGANVRRAVGVLFGSPAGTASNPEITTTISDAFFTTDERINAGVAFSSAATLRSFYLDDVSFPGVKKNPVQKVIFRRMLLAFHEFLGGKSYREEPTLTKAKEEVSRTILEVHQATKPIRSYHFVDSVHDIIANNIIASRGVMNNVIRIFGGADPNGDLVKTVAIDDDIVPADYVIGHRYSPNADNPYFLYLAGYGHLAEAMRPMYRGDLVLKGRPEIKPHDVVFIMDIHNKMWGPIEVERVTHTFSYDAGFTTTIIPHLYCKSTGTADWAMCNYTGRWMGVLAVAGLAAIALVPPLGIGYALGATSLGTGLALGTGLGGAAITDSYVQATTGAGAFELLNGKGWYGRMENPFIMTPLIRNGVPFVAAMEGFKAENWGGYRTTTDKLRKKQTKWLWRGLARGISQVTDGVDVIREAFNRIP